MFREKPELLCPCVDKYVDDGLDNALCRTCMYICETCISLDECETCTAGLYRLYNPDSKMCDCMDGYYDIGASFEQSECEPCDYTCKTCNVALDNCTSCDANAYRTLAGDNTCPCDLYFYDDLLNVQCLPCHYSCHTCSDDTTCDSCDSTKFRQDDPNTDTCICMDHYYDDGLDNQLCLPCEPTCLQCLDSTECTDCDETILRHLNVSADYKADLNPYCTCQYKFYGPLDPATTCLPCHYSCSYCSGPLSTDCLFCTADAFRSLDTTANTCPCDDGYYDNGTSLELCQPCHPYCLTCSNNTASSCFTCAGPYYFQTPMTCVTQCFDYYYENVTDMICYLCGYKCITCQTAPDKCEDCDIGFPLYKGVCYDTCPV